MKKYISAFRTGLPYLLLILLELVIFATNYSPGTRLIGWDVVTPEFMFPTHLMRSIVGVWQENRGLGLFDGMSHISNLIHTLTLWGMSFVLPNNLLRYFFILLCHLMGGIGMYKLLLKLFDTSTHHHPHGVAFIGAVIYMLNLITVQMFFTPLEAFAVHFAALPWITYSLLIYLKEGSRISLYYFILTCLIVTPQYFVTTLALPITLLLMAICAMVFLVHPSKQRFKRILISALFFVIINSFWMLPYVAGLPHNAPIIASAKINQMSSEEIFSRNQEYGDFPNIMLLRGFSLSFEDETTKNSYGFMMNAWRNHIESLIVLGISSLLAALTIFGFIQSLKIKNKILLPFSLLYILMFLILGNNIPFLTTVTIWLRTHIPFFAEAYRFPFTKFSILFVFSYTILCISGLIAFFQELSRFKRQISTVAIVVFTICLFWYAAPIFTGNFLYKNMRISLPAEYEKTFAFFQQQNPNRRIALLPQPSFWSWKFFDYGFRGSGFFWQGVPQPTMDRAFDPWSKTNENYYWELSHSLYSKDPVTFLAVLKKYDISYLVLDEHLASGSNNRTLFIDETKELLSKISSVRLISTFGKISIYENTDVDSLAYITIKENLPTVYPTYSWTDSDQAYFDLGNYISLRNADSAQNIYPFRSLFTKRSSNEREFIIDENDDSITIASSATATSAAILKQQARIYDSNGTDDISPQKVVQCGLVKAGSSSSLSFAENGNNILRFKSTDQRNCLTYDVFNLSHKDGYLLRVESRHIKGRPLAISIINKTARHIELETYLPANNDWENTYYILPPIATDGLDYSLYIYNDSIGEKESINDLKNISIFKIPFIELVRMQSNPKIPDAIQSRFDSSYTLTSVDHKIPSLFKISIDPSSMQSNSKNTLILSQSYDDGWIAWKTGEKCTVKSVKCELQNQIQNIFPFLFGTRLREHVLVNNWENGWILDSEKLQVKSEKSNDDVTIILFFWPQLLEWFGFLLLPLPFLMAKLLHTRHE